MAEITWSLMHPTPLNAEYVQRVIAEAEKYHVDSFEICALCHSPLGGMDGLVLYEEYPQIAATLDHEAIRENRRRLKEILSLAHASGRPVYYWHREVTVWPEVLKSFPDLMDGNGEFDLLGSAFDKLLRYKLQKTFEAVPELDGLVLTLTEADFSAIHNSTPEIYPPEKVVEKAVRIFAEEHAKRGKRFILRSFGSIAKDYEDILAGAKRAAKDFSFEVETKITPYDFSPFMPDNPFLRPIENLTMGAECDCLGEFLGAGYLPAENVRNIVRYVRYAQRCGVNRYAIRLDRIGHHIFDSYPINLFAYHRAIENPEITPEEIMREYAEKYEPAACRQTLRLLGEEGFSLVEKLNYVDHHVIFHAFPPPASDLKWLKAGGIFTVFAESADLQEHSGLWGILFWQKTPGRQAIIREKEEALAIAEKALAQLESIQNDLPETEYKRLSRLWNNAKTAAAGMLHFIRCIAAYFDDMEAGDASAASLHREAEAMTRALGEEVKVSASRVFSNGQDHSLFDNAPKTAREVYSLPLLADVKVLLQEYEMDFAARQKAGLRFSGGDFVLPGTLPDEIRCVRNMHASHALAQEGKLGRFAGNQVFPNGFLKIVLKGTNAPAKFCCEGKGEAKLSVNGREYSLRLENSPVIPLPPDSEYTVIFRKAGREYPWISLTGVMPEK